MRSQLHSKIENAIHVQTSLKVTLNLLMYQSIPSLTIPPPPPGRPPGIRAFYLPLGSDFRSFVLPGGLLPRGLKSKKKFDNFEKSAIFALSLKQMSSSSFHMFIYARSKQCDLGPIYTITNTQRIRIYPGRNPSWLKFHLIQDVNMANMTKKTKFYSRFLLLRIYPEKY